ncbi:MAG: hypothetical protein QMB63_02895 [Clostridiaceae bacterium]
MFNNKIKDAFDKVKKENENYDEEEFKRTIQDEMEKKDFLAMVLGAYRFFIPVFIVIIVLFILTLFM